MKFLWESNAPWAGTGYGGQTKLLLKALQQMGHEPNCFCFYGLSGGKITYDDYVCWPNSDYDAWGNDVIKLHAERAEAEVIATLIDLFVLNADIWGNLKLPWAAWVPIDSVGIGQMTQNLLKVCDYPVAMSNFGAQQISEAGVEVAATIYHAIDTDVFKPVEDPHQKDEFRELLELDKDAFVIAMVMANKGDRKQYPLQMQAIKQWMDENKDRKVQIYIHTEPTSAMGGWDLRELTRILGLSGSVYCTNQYDTVIVPAPPQFLRQIYCAADVVMNATSGEGFGIPIVEAQACGTPVITGNYTAMPEITKNGYAVEPQSKGLGGHFGWQFHPSVEEMVYRLECVYRMDNKANRDLGVVWAHSNFNINTIAAQWAEVLEYAKDNGKAPGKPPAQMPKEEVSSGGLQVPARS